MLINDPGGGRLGLGLSVVWKHWAVLLEPSVGWTVPTMLAGLEAASDPHRP